MIVTGRQRRICEQVVNVFETGSRAGNYACLSVHRDGPNECRQITYGRSQTTEYGRLKELLQAYVNDGGLYARQLSAWLPKIKAAPLSNDKKFRKYLELAGIDPVMHRIQDEFFGRYYFAPAINWASKHGFVYSLSLLVIYDSFSHSGGILDFLRNRFAERVPAEGGDEREWIKHYVDAREQWLQTAKNPAMHPTVYRMITMKTEIKRGNWNLDQLPILVQGVRIDGDALA